MNIVVFGKNGQLAQSLRNQANLDANYISSADVDFMKPTRVSEFLNDVSPELIVNCSAYTNVVAAESDEASAHKINVESVGKISEFCNLNNAHFIHVSTELVFDGEKKQPYTEDDPTNPLNVYGNTKMLGEQMVVNNCSKYAILRTSWLYSHYGENFLMKIFNAVLKGDQIYGVNDRFGNPTSAFELARVISRLVEKISKGENIEGVFHCAGSEASSRYNFVKMICEVMKEKGLISSYKIEESVSNLISDGVTRPENATFDCSKIKTLFDLKDKTLKNCIEEVIDYLV